MFFLILKTTYSSLSFLLTDCQQMTKNSSIFVTPRHASLNKLEVQTDEQKNLCSAQRASSATLWSFHGEQSSASPHLLLTPGDCQGASDPRSPHPSNHIPNSCWGRFLLIYLSSRNEGFLSRTICQERECPSRLNACEMEDESGPNSQHDRSLIHGVHNTCFICKKGINKQKKFSRFWEKLLKVVSGDDVHDVFRYTR